MTWNNALLSLQETDLALHKARKRLEEIATALDDDAAVCLARQQVQKTTAQAEAAKKAQKAVEFELASVETERKANEARLYGGAVRNSRQLEDLQAKVASLKRQKAHVEDQLLDAMLATEEAQDETNAAETTLQNVTAAWEKDHAQLLEEQQVLQQHVAELEATAAEAQAVIPADILDAYRYLQKKMDGLAVARLNNDICSICGIEVTSQRQQTARAGKETYCDGCGRILVV